MILGIYWYFDYPKDIYIFKYFKFKKGIGGHGNSPALLETYISSDKTEFIINEITILVKENKGTFINIERNNKNLNLTIPEYQFYDFEFEFALKIEEILIKYKSKVEKNHEILNGESFNLENKVHNKSKGLNKNFLQIVGSSLKKSNAENSSIRFDCNFEKNKLKNILIDIKKMSDELNIDVVYFKSKEVGKRLNVMILFTNGRQGINLKTKKETDLEELEKETEIIIKNHNLKIGHIDGYENYPKENIEIIKIIDEEYII